MKALEGDLHRLLVTVNEGRDRRARTQELLEAEGFLEESYRCSRALATYGTLAPGRSNHSRLAHLSGRWLKGHVFGHLRQVGWGASAGYPALEWDPEGDKVEVSVLVSNVLPDHWSELDRFEGNDYLRFLIPVHDDAGIAHVANLYGVG